MMYLKSDKDSVAKAVESLKKGEVTILPTDTVYGFSGIVDVADAVKKYHTDVAIRAIKGRAETKPLIELIAKPEDIKLYTDDVLPDSLLSKWPGALTVIVHCKTNAPLADKPQTVAFRCPGDRWIREVIEKCGCPIFSTSVNRSGSPVLDTVAAIDAEFGKEAALIISDGDKKGALPSTLVSFADGKITVLRQGTVTI